MHRVHLTWIALLLLMLASGPARADDVPPWLSGESRPEDLSISLVTMGPGDEVHQYFGHIALEVHDRRLRLALLYNFGTFEFDRAFLLEFLRGRLEFWLGVQPTVASYTFYAQQDRDVRLAELDLPPARRARLARDLAENALPKNRTYRYHHYDDNCATRIVDVLDRALDNRFKPSLSGPARLSFRDHTRRYAARDPLIDWLLVFAMNDSMEQRITRQDELFLPEELEQAVMEFRVPSDGHEHPLIQRKVVFHKAQQVREVYAVPPVTWPYTLAVGIGIGGCLVLSGRMLRAGRRPLWRVLLGCTEGMVGLIFGLLGSVVTALALLSEHTVTYWNENLFFANPFTLWLAPVGFALALRDDAWARRLHTPIWTALAALSALGLLLKPLPGFDQENAMVWTLLAPITLGGFLAAYWMRERQEKGCHLSRWSSHGERSRA